MACSPTAGNFLPHPVETTARTSRRRDRGGSETTPVLTDRIYHRRPNSPPTNTPDSLSIEPMHPASVIRHFLTQPVETSTTSSRFANSQKKEEDCLNGNGNRHVGETCHNTSGEELTDDPQYRHYVHRPIYTTARPVGKDALDHHPGKPQPIRRRFTPEPTETTSKSSRHQQAKGNDEVEAPQARRRLFPDSIVTPSSKNTRKKGAETSAGYQSRVSGGEFAPEPIEAIVRHRRNRNVEENPDPPSSSDLKTMSQPSNGVSKPRKFSPELIETASGSFKKADRPSRLRSSRTSTHPPGIPRYLQTTLIPKNGPCPGFEEVPQIHESRFSAASLARRQARQHSLPIPELPSIVSDSSGENSAVPSLSTSPSVSSANVANQQCKEDVPDGPDSDIRGYMLSPPSTAEHRLRAQAMAAYVNEQVHEPVQHFAAEDTDEESLSGRLNVNNGIDPRTFRRESSLECHMKEMRGHHAQLEDARKALRENDAGQSPFSSKALLARDQAHVKKMAGRNEKEVGLANTRNAVSPPMLGDDLVFAMSVSPKVTRCDVDQIPVPRRHEHDENEDNTGERKLWSAAIQLSNNAECGLWMGLCQKKEGNEQSLPTPRRTGLLTPAVDSDHDDRGAGLGHGQGYFQLGHNLLPLPQSLCSSHENDPSMASTKPLNEEPSMEQQIEEEFDDGFVTQIYNYLSLGYPSLAHKFDDELSKISRIPVHELRRDDELADAKGYVGAPEGNGLDQFSARAGKCARWTALRLYIHEWARQQPVMADSGPNDWGVRVRRGSWAV